MSMNDLWQSDVVNWCPRLRPDSTLTNGMHSLFNKGCSRSKKDIDKFLQEIWMADGNG
jgi:hypothetical protein